MNPMNTSDANGIPPDVMADMQAVAEAVASGKPLDPEIARRVRERGARITEEIRNKYGLLDVAVPAIRELRGELPGP